MMAWALTLLALCLGGLAVVGLHRRSRTHTRARRGPTGVQEARIRVERGYLPSHIELEAGVPALLRFDRREDDPCSELLVCDLLPNQHRLIAHQETSIRFTPQRPGRYAFTCGMGMYSGEINVRPRWGSQRPLSRIPDAVQSTAARSLSDHEVR